MAELTCRFCAFNVDFIGEYDGSLLRRNCLYRDMHYGQNYVVIYTCTLLGSGKVWLRFILCVITSVSLTCSERTSQYGYKMETLGEMEHLFEQQTTRLKHASRDAKRDPSNITENIVPWSVEA